ncbi:DNA-binding protein [Paenibacillus larvae subsp. pulvifaciens]|uniref:DNA-binding protein n=1 Tax=Paenibacillus larvae subsp. pulvifaciens TaxID=1477 RepID=A0A1V0UPG6_9BACL|nr:helix-turn-helix domain-containing protein [Paenibacillus larvae]ARF67074.1 DNA-binding protein [Paenibacillus larvae subsp. pulvifaciens]
MERSTLTVLEVAAYIGVSDDTIYSMVREKQIPYVRVRRRILFRKETIDAWMSQQEQQLKNGGIA